MELGQFSPRSARARLGAAPHDGEPASIRGHAAIRASLRPSDALRDMALVLLTGVAVFALASWFEFYEIVSRWTAPYERWQLDELPVTLLSLAAGLGWFAWRRLSESRREGASRAAAELENARLLRHNRELAQRLLTLQERERQTLARELHDELGQCCTAIRADAAYIVNSLRAEPRTEPPLLASANAILETASQLYEAVHGMLHRLRPAALDALGVAAALEDLCAAWQQRHGVTCSFSWSPALGEPGEPTRITVYRLVQEALTNVARHAGASRACVSCAPADSSDGQEPARLRLSVQDDGCGFEPGRQDAGLGILGMRERVAALGGTMHVKSEVGVGAMIEVVLPLCPERPGA